MKAVDCEFAKEMRKKIYKWSMDADEDVTC